MSRFMKNILISPLEKKCMGQNNVKVSKRLNLYFGVIYPFNQTQPWSIFVFLTKVNGGENCVCLATHYVSVGLTQSAKETTHPRQSGRTERRLAAS